MKIRPLESQFINLDFSLQPLRDETGRIAFLIPSAQGGAVSSGLGAAPQPFNVGASIFLRRTLGKTSPYF